MTVTLLGGDIKSYYIAKALKKMPISVHLCGFEKCETAKEMNVPFDYALEKSDRIILPLPSTRDSETVITPFSDDIIKLSDITHPERVLGALCPKKYGFFDYYDEVLKTYNAIPSAEGALAIALKESMKTLWRSECLVIGYGKIGKVLCNRLKSFGAITLVSARKETDRAKILSENHKFIYTSEIADGVYDTDIIFNTVPHLVITEEVISRCKKSAIIIDLATGYGTDFKAAESYGIKAIKASGLPALYSPVTAAEITAQRIADILGGRNI